MTHVGDIGRRIRAFREEKGLTRQALAQIVGVNRSAIAAWEAGEYAPRPNRISRIAKVLGVAREALTAPAGSPPVPMAAHLVDTVADLPELLLSLTRRSELLRAFRLAAPYPTAAYVQTEWRHMVAERVLSGALEVQRIEIIYDLARLKEILSNVVRYDGRKYIVKGYCCGANDVAPAMGGYMFDNAHFLLGAYWTGLPPTNKPGLHMTSEPFASFFGAYWGEVWSRGIPLNLRGKHDLSAIRKVAIGLGLDPARWGEFEEEAKAFDVGDGAPPLI